MTPTEFIAAVMPAAKASEAITGIPAGFVVAEGAQESGWGAHAPGNNLFGVKADPGWKGDLTNLQTREYVHGAPVMIMAKFRAYPDWSGCIADHADYFKQNKRYAACFTETTAEGFTRAVAAAGYATDPKYADEIIAIIRAHGLG